MPVRTQQVDPVQVSEAIGTTRENSAPVNDSPRIQVGSELARVLLKIVAGSIVLFVLYLAVLDGFTSGEVNQVYSRTFEQMHNAGPAVDFKGADETTRILEAAKKSPNTPIGADDAKMVHDVVDDLKKSKRVAGPNATRLDSCDQLATKSANAGPPSSNKKYEVAKNKNAEQNAKVFGECIDILDPLRRASESHTFDLEQLRLMKEYAKDAHDHRQAFRSFWLQAAQLVLLNLLLPLLTALLGYIFGSQQSSRNAG